LAPARPAHVEATETHATPNSSGGTFDVRFANGGALAPVASGAGPPSVHDVKLQGVAYPLTLRLQGGSRAGAVRVRKDRGPDADVTTLTAEAPSVTLQDGDGQLQVGLQPAPDQFSLQNSAPNPASGPATIAFSVPEQTHVTIDVFDVLGRRVATLADGQREPGRHDVRLDVGSLSSGTYFYRMSAEGFSKTRRLEVVR
jgi:hypothetical protein